jgi:hypothetical protein
MVDLKRGKRLTLVMDFDVAKALRKIQAEKIKKTRGNVSFSHVVNAELRKCLGLK